MTGRCDASTQRPLFTRAAPAAAVILMLAAPACGQDYGTRDDPREIDIETVDASALEPMELTVAQGETVRFTVTNLGQQSCTFIVGDDEAQEQYDASGEVGVLGNGVDPSVSLELEPGQRRSLTYSFEHSGHRTVEYACHPAGYESDAVGEITVPGIEG